MNRCFVSLETDPYFNVAAEHELFLTHPGGTSFFLWQNESAVIAGRNQNFFAECDMEYLRKNNIRPVRRFSGGGCVFQDLGNLNFTFIAREEDRDEEKYRLVLRRALWEFGVGFEENGRNDLVVSGKKFSGHAYFADEGKALVHGTLMVNVDLGVLERVLTPSALKLSSKGIPSVKSRVVNLSKLSPAVTTESLKEALLRAFSDVFGTSGEALLLGRENMAPPLWRKISRDEWIFGETPGFSVSLERKLPFGLVSVSADMEDGRIRKIKIYSDALQTIDFTAFEAALTGVIFEEDVLFARIEEYMRIFTAIRRGL